MSEELHECLMCGGRMVSSSESDKVLECTDCGMKHVIIEPCSCGSGLPPYWVKDARGIPLCKVCKKCHKQKLSKYRPEVLTNPQYEADEPIEPEE